MGTPDFAVPCLQAIVNAGYDVCGVVSQPDRPKGRGRKVAPSPVKEAALRPRFKCCYGGERKRARLFESNAPVGF